MVTSKEDRKEDGYMKHFISDHTPMDDYQGILQQGHGWSPIMQKRKKRYRTTENAEHFFWYYTRKVRRTIQWTDKLLNADRLFDALQILEKRK